ncbi:hypothetical protein R3P38DRAFT_2759885 [Favolaschia claudopus]|uniref:Transmembrane protein n=1 Tax=Favolaschia claudopus TaxID=2862362 RepID=A0AAW0E1I0_9AGAR
MIFLPEDVGLNSGPEAKFRGHIDPGLVTTSVERDSQPPTYEEAVFDDSTPVEEHRTLSDSPEPYARLKSAAKRRRLRRFLLITVFFGAVLHVALKRSLSAKQAIALHSLES